MDDEKLPEICERHGKRFCFECAYHDAVMDEPPKGPPPKTKPVLKLI